jgi:hypothetical protein
MLLILEHMFECRTSREVVMSALQVAEPVALWTAKGLPARLVWHGIRYLVTDTPTPLRGDSVAHEALTHPPQRLLGWRFQGTSTTDPADVRVFDVHRVDGERWELIATYE